MSILSDNRPIGFFDSGVGGLTVLKKLKELLPNENCIFFGDTLHVPYGDKTKSQLLEYSDSILKFFEQQNCKAVVMACNTTSSVIFEDINNKYDFKLYPVVQSVAKVLADLDVQKLGVFATKATILSGAYTSEIAKYNSNIQVFGQYCSDWVKIVENNLLNDDISIEIVKSDLDKMLKNKPDKIVLGCTHYPYLIGILSKFVPKEMFIDPAVPFANYICEDLKNMNLINFSHMRGDDQFYTSSNPELFRKSSKLFYTLTEAPILKTF